MRRQYEYTPATARLIPGKASRYIDPIEIAPGDRIIIVCRVSSEAQRRNGNLNTQEAQLAQAVYERNGTVIAVFSEVCQGNDLLWLINAAAIAKLNGASILAYSTDRFVRQPAFSPRAFHDFEPRESDFRHLRFYTEGVRLMTLFHPDATQNEVRGERAKGNEGGRPRKAMRPRRYKPRCDAATVTRMLGLHSEGHSLQDIADETGYSRSTVQGLIARCTNSRIDHDAAVG